MKIEFKAKMDVCRRYDAGEKQLDIARDYGVTRNAVKGVIWKMSESGHVTLFRRLSRSDWPGWTVGRCLDLMEMIEPQRGGEKWDWEQVANYFRRDIYECKQKFRDIAEAPEPKFTRSMKRRHT